MKKITTIIALLFLCSCAPAHIYDLDYKIEHYWVVNGGHFKYRYTLSNGKKVIYLHSNTRYMVDKKFKFNQN